MGGKGSGGARPGAGRKPKNAALKVLHGTATLADRLKAAADAQAAKPTGVNELQPKDLEPEELEVWTRLAPLATSARTLTPETVPAFRLLCQQVVFERQMHERLETEGLTIDTPMGLKAHPLLNPHRQMMQRVEAGMQRFKLSAFGKELAPAAPEAPKNRLVAMRGGRA